MGAIMSNSATGPSGRWRVDRRLLAASALLLSALVVLIWPVDVVPDFPFDDAVMHFTAGIAMTAALAAVVPVRDDLIAGVVGLLGFVWEPFEWWLFDCYWNRGVCSTGSLESWMLVEDTAFDIALVLLGSFVALVLIGRYR